MATETRGKIIIDAIDNTKNAFKSVDKGVQSFSSKIGGVTKLLGGAFLAAGAGAVGFLYSAAKGAAEAQASFAKVTTTLNNTLDAMKGPEWNDMVKSLGEIKGSTDDFDSILVQATEKIQAMSAATVQLGFDDEAAAESIAQLFQRTGDLTKANELNNLAMDLARAKNIDLSTASNAVGMVLSGNTKVLKQFGIEIDETMTPMEQLGELQTKVAGQSQAFAETFQGRMLVLSESVSNLKDTIGAAVLEAITPFITSLSEWAADPAVQEKIKAIAEAVGNFAKIAIPVIIGAVQILYGWFQKIVDIISDVIVWFDQLDKKINKIVDSIKRAASATLNFLKGGGSEKRAVGGAVNMNQAYTVGEHGPETFVPHSSGRIIPNGRGGGGGNSIVINNPMFLDRATMQRVSEELAHLLRKDFRY